MLGKTLESRAFWRRGVTMGDIREELGPELHLEWFWQEEFVTSNFFFGWKQFDKESVVWVQKIGWAGWPMVSFMLKVYAKGREVRNFCCRLLKKNIYLYRGEEREKERETSMCGCLSSTPYWGIWPTTQSCALPGNWTSKALVCSPVLDSLSHTSQGYCRLFEQKSNPGSLFILILIINFLFTASTCWRSTGKRAV